MRSCWVKLRRSSEAPIARPYSCPSGQVKRYELLTYETIRNESELVIRPRIRQTRR